MINFSDYMEEASANFLTTPLPTDHTEWGDAELQAHIERYAWDAVCALPYDEIYGLIEACAEGFWRLHKREATRGQS